MSCQGYADADIDPTVQPCLRFGRPNLPEIFQKMQAMAVANKDSDVAVLACGPNGMVSQVRQLCHAMSGTNGVKFDFHGELFDF